MPVSVGKSASGAVGRGSARAVRGTRRPALRIVTRHGSGGASPSYRDPSPLSSLTLALTLLQ